MCLRSNHDHPLFLILQEHVWGKRPHSRRSAQVLLCLPCVCVCVCTCACTRLVTILACKTQSRQMKTDITRWGVETQKQWFYISVQMCKSCSHTQCNWKHRRRQRRGQGFRSDMTRRGEMEKQLTITATTEALELYGERNGEWLRNISGRKRVIFGMTCKYIITDTPRHEFDKWEVIYPKRNSNTLHDCSVLQCVILKQFVFKNLESLI